MIILNLEDEYEFNLTLYLQSIYKNKPDFLVKLVNILHDPTIAMLLSNEFLTPWRYSLSISIFQSWRFFPLIEKKGKLGWEFILIEYKIADRIVKWSDKLRHRWLLWCVFTIINNFLRDKLLMKTKYSCCIRFLSSHTHCWKITCETDIGCCKNEECTVFKW